VNAPKNVISGTNTVKFAKMKTFWQFSKSQAFMQKLKALFFSVINKTSHFDKHDFSEHNSLVSAVARSLPFIFTNPNVRY
jgi:hypothetical protein